MKRLTFSRSLLVANFDTSLRFLGRSISFSLSYMVSISCVSGVRILQQLKNDMCLALVTAVDNNQLFRIETDACGTALAARLSKGDWPVAIFSLMLTYLECFHPAVEREVADVVDYGSLPHHRSTGSSTYIPLQTNQLHEARVELSNYCCVMLNIDWEYLTHQLMNCQKLVQ